MFCHPFSPPPSTHHLLGPPPLPPTTFSATSSCLLLHPLPHRKNLDPNYESRNEAPNILFNAATWGLHMGLSSNLRYQVLGGTDRVSDQV